MSERFHRAPWGPWLRWSTAGAAVVLVGVAVLGLTTGPHPLPGWSVLMVWFPLLTLVGASLFAVRGYRVAGRVLEVARPLWTTRVDLEGLRDAAPDAEAFRGAIRLFGNGGLFSFTGLYRSRRLGRFRAFVSDPRRSVVLRIGERTCVVSPQDPAAFVGELRSAFHLSGERAE